MLTLALNPAIDQAHKEKSSPLEAIERLIEQCTLAERLEVSAIASLSAGEAAIALKQDFLRPKKIKEELSSLGLVGTEINKYIKLYEKFGEAKHLFVGLGASMLMSLSVPRMEPVRSHILDLDEPVDQEMVNALKKELIPAPQKKAKLNGGEWVASPGGGSRKYRIAGEIGESETAEWLSERVEANNGLMYAVIAEFKETAYELQALKSTASLTEAATDFDSSFAFAPTPTCSDEAVATSDPVEAILSPDVQYPTPNTQYPIPLAIEVGDRVVVVESDRGWLGHQGVVIGKEVNLSFDGWQVRLDEAMTVGVESCLLFTSNQLAPLTVADTESTCEPMTLLDVELAGGDIKEFIDTIVEVRSLSGQVKFNGILKGCNDKNYFVNIATAEGDRIADLRETWVV